MARSLKKGPFIAHHLEKKVQANIEQNKKTVIKTWSRASMISPDMVVKLSQYTTGNLLSQFM